MLSNSRIFFHRLVLAMLVTFSAGSAAIAQDAAWRVSKSSGDVWVMPLGAEPAALTDEASLNPGDTIRTGANGRVLLVRGAETILISANSVVGIPEKQIEGVSSIIEQAGSILLDVEKRNVQHFEVLTPYLAAVVKGTQFRVTVDNTGSQVDVLRGQVQVTDYQTGEYTLVNPDQAAKVSLQGPEGLSLSGSGIFSLIEPGVPRSSSVSPITIPDEGFSAPSPMENGKWGHTPAWERRVEWAPTSSGKPSKDYGLASGLLAWSKSVLGLGGHKYRDDPVSLLLAIPPFVGLFVAVGARVLRRKQKRK